jgi:hypothetical protein
MSEGYLGEWKLAQGMGVTRGDGEDGACSLLRHHTPALPHGVHGTTTNL